MPKRRASQLQIWANERWKNRRRMAWICLVANLLLMGVLVGAPESMLTIEKIKVLESPIAWFLTVNASVIGAYVGFATLADVKSRYRRRRDDDDHQDDSEESNQ